MKKLKYASKRELIDLITFIYRENEKLRAINHSLKVVSALELEDSDFNIDFPEPRKEPETIDPNFQTKKKFFDINYQ